MQYEKSVNDAIEKTFSGLGTVNHIRAYGSNEKVMETAVARVAEIECRMSAFLADSDLSRLSRSAGKGFQPVHPDTYRLIQKAVAFSALSQGAMDITIRPLVELWGINKKGNFIPSDNQIKAALNFVNYRDIRFDDEHTAITLERPGQSLDLGGIAKGYAADEVKRILQENGVKSALVNLGGNVTALGARPDGSPWRIGIQNPLAPTGEYIGVLSVQDRAVVTSGTNERFFIRDGVRYHHILNPETGKPAQSPFLSATVVCSSSADADALTTALFVLGPERGTALLEKFHAQAIFVAEDLSVTITRGLFADFELSGN